MGIMLRMRTLPAGFIAPTTRRRSGGGSFVNDAPGFFPFVGNPACGPHVRHSGAELEAGEVLAATLAARMKYPCFGNSVRALSVSACMGGPATRQGGTP